MKILGIDTTTKFFCLGLSSGTKIYEYNLELERLHSRLVIPTIKRVLEALDWRINEIDYFACGLGPGSFTGMRIGIAAIKGLAWALNKPIAAISTLDILARNADSSAINLSGARLDSCFIVPAIDAKRNLIYCSIYRKRGAFLKRTAPYLLLSTEEFFKKIKHPSIILGDAVALYKEKMLKKIKGALILDKDYWYPCAHHLITLAQEKIKKKKLSSPFELKPIYLYPKECQVRK